MISKQITWRQCTDEEKAERIALDSTLTNTKMYTGENKSRPGARIRKEDENESFSYFSRP
jgi:hypothetical protein